AASPITFAINTTSAGTLTATATETVPPTPNVDNITVNAGITVQSTGGDVVFQAGDNIVINATAQVLAPAGNISFTSGFGDNDGEGAQTLDGTISASATTGVVTLNLSAQQGATQAGTGSITGNQLLLLGVRADGNISLVNANAAANVALQAGGSIVYNSAGPFTFVVLGPSACFRGANNTSGAGAGADMTICQAAGTLTVNTPLDAGAGGT